MAVKRSLKVTGAFTARLKRSNRNRKINVNTTGDGRKAPVIQYTYELGLTLTRVYVQGYTDLKSPSIVSNVRSDNIKVNFQASDILDIIERINEIDTGYRDNDEVEEGAEVGGSRNGRA